MRKYGIKHSASLYDHARAIRLDAKRDTDRMLQSVGKFGEMTLDESIHFFEQRKDFF